MMSRRRWFFRVRSLTLLILCLAVWRWSYAYALHFRHLGREWSQQFEVCERGLELFADVWGFETEWSLSLLPSQESTEPRRSWNGQRWLGFKLMLGPDHPWRQYYLRVPWWFPTLLLTALTWWTWRKRRGEGERGFAVEGADPVGEESGEKRA
jgi:hypothetical protein